MTDKHAVTNIRETCSEALFIFGLFMLFVLIFLYTTITFILIRINIYWMILLFCLFRMRYLYNNAINDHFKRLIIYVLTATNGLMMYEIIHDCDIIPYAITYTDFCFNITFITRNDKFAFFIKFATVAMLLLFEIAFLLKQTSVRLQEKPDKGVVSTVRSVMKYVNIFFIILLAVICIQYTSFPLTPIK